MALTKFEWLLGVWHSNYMIDLGDAACSFGGFVCYFSCEIALTTVAWLLGTCRYVRREKQAAGLYAEWLWATDETIEDGIGKREQSIGKYKTQITRLILHLNSLQSMLSSVSWSS